MASVTVAGIDCGTNSIRLKVARVDEHGMEEIVPRTLRVIRLGQDVDQTHRFADEALERAYAAAGEFAEILREHPVDGIRFVATSATRDAENREQFEDAMERILGVRPEVIPGTEEADLSFLGATSVVERDLEAPYVVIDLGGGSTELVLGGLPLPLYENLHTIKVSVSGKSAEEAAAEIAALQGRGRSERGVRLRHRQLLYGLLCFSLFHVQPLSYVLQRNSNGILCAVCASVKNSPV